MAVESANFPSQLNSAWPLGIDFKNEGDNHIRLLKNVIQQTFPGLGARALSFQSPAKSAPYSLTTTDNLQIQLLTGALTVGAAAAASLGSGHITIIITDTNDSTFDPNAAETVNGATTYLMAKSSIIWLFCDGTAWHAITCPKAAFGTAAFLNVGTAPGNVVQLDPGTGKLPAVDGSLLTNMVNTLVTVRQTVIKGALTATGVADWLAAGAGLTVNLKATAVAVVLAFAGGFAAGGAVDNVTQLSADAANQFGAIPANNTTYLFMDRLTATTAVGSNTLVPPQYGPIFDRTRAAMLRFAGAAGSTIFLDDYGNTWTANGGAKIQTNQLTFSVGGLGGSVGGTNALNGSTDFIRTTDITTLGLTNWSARGWVRATVLPGVGAVHTFWSALNTGDFGAALFIINSGGTIRFGYSLSSDGATQNITGGAVLGTSLPAINTNYYVELTFDNGVYRLKVGGVQEASTTSNLRVCNISRMQWGGVNSGGWGSLNGYMNEVEFLTYCDHPSNTAYAVPVAAPTINPAGKLTTWFDTVNMTMWEATAASVAAGSPPTFTARSRLFVGEALAGAATITLLRNYAYQGRFDNSLNPVTFAAPGINYIDHNLGVPIEFIENTSLARTAGINTPWTENPQTWNGTYPFNTTSSISRNTTLVSANSTGLLLNFGNSIGNSSSPGNSASTGWLALRARRTF